jgi:hypothetical protein
MTIKSLQKMICLIILTAVLIPCVVSAQDNVQTYSNQTFSREELAQMLAPIALYPDALLSQILMAAAYPFEVADARRWLTNNPYVTGDALDEALKVKDWDVSILALCHYPKILTMMSENLSWTARLGDAFANQEEDVLDAVQELRAGAYAAGNLATTKEQIVIAEDRIIRIEPSGADFIYVPAYDPYVTYGDWWYPMYPPLRIFLPGLFIAGPGIIFSPRFSVGFGVFGWSSFNWRERHVIVVNMDRTRRFYRHADDYRGADHRPWRPDRDRRFVREKRGGEIPRFSPPVKPLSNGQRGDRRPGGDVRAPDNRRMTPDKTPVLDRDRRSPQPRLRDQDRKPDAVAPGVIIRDKQPPGAQPETNRGKRPDNNSAPRIIDRDKPRQPDSRTVEKSQPVIRERNKAEGIEPRQRPPLIDPKGATEPDKVRERDMKSDQRITPREERQDGPQRSMDRDVRRP